MSEPAAPTPTQVPPADSPQPSTLRNAIVWTVGLWLLLIVFALLTKVAVVSLLAIAVTGALPFILVVLWLSLSTAGSKLRAWLDLWLNRLFGAALLFCYGTYAHKWASDLINELFNLDGRFFGITSTVLAVFFTPFGLVYRQEIVSSVNLLFAIALLSFGPALLISLLFAPGWKTAFKRAFVLSSTILACSAFLALITRLTLEFKPVVKSFAVWADFNDNHLCTDDWPAKPKSVVFLDNGKVLGYFPESKADKFKVLSCDYQKTF